MSGERRFQVNAAQVLSTSTFFARQMLVSNLLPRWLYFRFGGSDIPTAANADLSVPPLTVQLVPLPTVNMVTVGLGPVLVTLGQQVSAAQNAVVTLYESASPVGIGSIDLNPTRMGQSSQQSFLSDTAVTLAFPATQIHIQNYSGAWIYIAYGTLVIPTAINAMASVPPMSERSLPCPPNTQFAMGVSADLTTKGQQVPAGMKIIATFYEYPTPVAIGTADLNPSKMGKMAQQKFVAASSYTMGFPVTTVHVANYSPAWVYVKFNSLVIPTVATADVTLPPMTEKSLTCLPATDFAFGLSSNLVTRGQQVPAGVNIIATFFEYPTPVSVGTANLNPTRLGNSVSTSIMASSVIDPAFPVAQINVSNYLQNWIYATYNQANRLLNPDMENWTGAVLDNWVWAPGGNGTVTQSTPYRGSFSARITKGPIAGFDVLSQIFATTPADALTLSFWYATDGITSPRYYIYDVTNAAFILGPIVLAAVTAYTQVRASFVVPAGCLQVQIVFFQNNVSPNGAWANFDAACVQLTTTAANAQIAVPPLSEKSITLPPSTHVDIVVGTQTVMTTTALPVTACLLTLYEYAVPTNLGAAPLSPGGFRYIESLYPAGVTNVVGMSGVFRNLSNFNRGRFSLSWNTPNPVDTNVNLSIFRSTGGAFTTPLIIIPPNQSQRTSVEFNAGSEIYFLFSATDMSGGALPAATINITYGILEAW